MQRKDDIVVVQGKIIWGIKVFIPRALRNQMLTQLHEAHFGVVRMKMIARNREV